MFIYAIQTYFDSSDRWSVLTTVMPGTNRANVLKRFAWYIKNGTTSSAKQKSRQYRLAKFHYGGCRHLENPRAR